MKPVFARKSDHKKKLSSHSMHSILKASSSRKSGRSYRGENIWERGHTDFGSLTLRYNQVASAFK